MDEIRCSIKIEDRAEGKPTRLIGTLLPFNVRAKDRAEMFLARFGFPGRKVV